jgi:hypothetical protein
MSAFLAEKWPRPSRCFLYDFYKRAIERRRWRLKIPVSPLRERLTEWDQFLEDAPAAGTLEKRLREILLPRYLWADQLAIDFANRYRSAYIFCYLLAAVVVFIALFGIFLHADPAELIEKAGPSEPIQWKEAILKAGQREQLSIGSSVWSCSS